MSTKECPACKADTTFRHMHDCAHGITETHMAGSERYICVKCNHTFYKHEGEKHGFIFNID